MRDNNNEEYIDDALTTETNQREKPKVSSHKVRRSIEELMERQALKRRLSDVFEEDYVLD